MSEAATEVEPDEHDHEWTPCEGCIEIINGRGCPCSGGRCPECP